uniref:Uncharacterized protein n=1 Tax=Cuerna arida TaxID=1464854 RepID=A0A1B6GAV8_9HEMI
MAKFSNNTKTLSSRFPKKEINVKIKSNKKFSIDKGCVISVDTVFGKNAVAIKRSKINSDVKITDLQSTKGSKFRKKIADKTQSIANKTTFVLQFSPELSASFVICLKQMALIVTTKVLIIKIGNEY